MIAICCVYYRCLALVNLAASLYSIRQQDLTHVEEIVVLDNNTDDPVERIQAEIDALDFPVPVRLLSCKHGDSSKTHTWSTNTAVRATRAPWVLFTRADYLLAFDAVERFTSEPSSPLMFMVGGYVNVHCDIETCERTEWRRLGPSVLGPLGREYGHTIIDAGVWYASRQAFDMVDGLDERLTVYGHAQTHFQHKLYLAGVAFVRLPEILFYHPQHGYDAPKDLGLAHKELEAIGVSLPEMWARYDGPNHPHYDDRGVFHG